MLEGVHGNDPVRAAAEEIRNCTDDDPISPERQLERTEFLAKVEIDVILTAATDEQFSALQFRKPGWKICFSVPRSWEMMGNFVSNFNNDLQVGALGTLGSKTSGKEVKLGEGFLIKVPPNLSIRPFGCSNNQVIEKELKCHNSEGDRLPAQTVKHGYRCS